MPVPLLRAAEHKQGGALPDPFPSLARPPYRAQFRRGQLAMLAGPPGGGKTLMALIAALQMQVPALYISADSDETTMAARAAAAITGHTVSTAEQVINHAAYREVYGAQVQKLGLRFVFEPSEPSIEDLANALTAYAEVHGAIPELVVVDNLMNLKADDGNEWSAMRQACKDLHWLARKSNACVFVLHHTSEQDTGHIQTAPPRPAVQGKVSQLPALILTVANHQNEMFVAVVKNRHGAADPMALSPLRWIVDFTTCQIYDEPMKGSVKWLSPEFQNVN